MNAFVKIGLIGLFIALFVHFALPKIVRTTLPEGTLEIIYPIFIAFLVIGIGLSLKIKAKIIEE